MADDFTVYQGTDVTPYVSVTSDGTTTGTPIDLSNWSAATWVAFSLPLTEAQTPSITKHKADMTVGIDPLFDPPSETQNSIFFPLTNQDLGADGIFGQYRHELRITLNSKQYVVYPLVGIAATFMVDESLSWNATTDPPAPRLVRLGGQPRIDITPQKEEIPKPPATHLPQVSRPDSVTAKPVYLSANMKQKLWPEEIR
jgi:hypothetical protein